MMTDALKLNSPDQSENLHEEKEDEADLQETELENLFTHLGGLTPGQKIVEKKNGKTVGVIITPPVHGTMVALAQMRLEYVGLLDGKGNSRWERTNKVVIGNSEKEFRLLPYLPLWWPTLNSSNGKEKESE